MALIEITGMEERSILEKGLLEFIHHQRRVLGLLLLGYQLNPKI